MASIASTPNDLRRFLPRGDTLTDEIWRKRHRFLLSLLAAHALALPVFGVAAGHSLVHSVAEGGLVPAAFAVGALAIRGPRKACAALVSLGLLSCSALLTHFSGGYIEAHFHFFIMIVILGLYEDWLPFGLALAYVVLHHGIGGALDPEGVYNHPAAQEHPWRWAAVHGAAISMAALLSILSWKLNEELRGQKDTALRELGDANVRLEGLDRAKSDFVATVSHELRTPLTSIYGFAHTLRKRWNETSDADRYAYIEVIESQSDRLSRLVADLLDMSRIEAGALSPRAERFELEPVLRRAAAGFEGPHINLACPSGLHVVADADHVEQIVVNYLANAVKYGGEPIRVIVSQQNGSLDLRVIDNGPGVPSELVPRLFEKFARGAGPVSREGDGTGLGLAIVRGLARANDGDAWYEPADGRGACFAVRLRSA